MAKVTTQHALTINKLMIPLINTVAYYDENDADLTLFTLCESDIAHDEAALDVFNTTLCASTLHDNIMQQDTLPRAHFYTVLKYIEDNKSISAKYYACS